MFLMLKIIGYPKHFLRFLNSQPALSVIYFFSALCPLPIPAIS